ncbi:terminase [Arcanobacterium canis]
MKKGQAKYATKRNPSNPTLGGVADAVSLAVRGRAFMPWQRQVADVACELDPTNPGAWRYETVIVTVPRQAGKSDLMGAIHTHRLLAFKDHIAVMTAQTGKDAGKRWKKIVDDVPPVDLEKRFKVNRGKGSELLRFNATGSTLAPFAPTASAGHGDSNTLASVDEAWAFSQAQGEEIEAAIKPTFLTVINSQLWIFSTRGTGASTWLNDKIALGRAAVNDPESKIAYFEWSADEELADSDPYGDDTLAFHPAIGYTQTARKIRDLGADSSLGDWRRSYLNLGTDTVETAYDLAVWDSLRWNFDPQSAPKERPRPSRPEDIAIAWDIALDGTSATIAAGWLDDDGDPATAIAATAPGTQWLRPALRKLAAKGYRAIVADASGPNQTVIQELENEVPTEIYSWGEYQAACQSFADRLREGTLTHDGNSEVAEAIKHAVLRSSSKARVIDAAKSTGPVDALRATVLAQHAAATRLSAPVIQIF